MSRDPTPYGNMEYEPQHCWSETPVYDPHEYMYTVCPVALYACSHCLYKPRRVVLREFDTDL